jgi:hypothetical protein
MPTHVVSRTLPIVLLGLVVGCFGSGLNPVSGKVTHKGDPAKGAVLVFVPKGAKGSADRPSGMVGEDGSFTLVTGSKPGAPAGEYDVTITWPETVSKPKPKGKVSLEPDDDQVRDRLGGRYADAAKSGLSATITRGSNTLPTFELK